MWLIFLSKQTNDRMTECQKSVAIPILPNSWKSFFSSGLIFIFHDNDQCYIISRDENHRRFPVKNKGDYKYDSVTAYLMDLETYKRRNGKINFLRKCLQQFPA